jgi:phage terminase large subunit GpA-like protein
MTLAINPLRDPGALIASIVEAVFRPPARPDYNAWAEDGNINFGRESFAPGAYRRSTLPPMERILECLSPEHPSRVVTVVASAQIMKTTLAQIFVAATMDLDPCDMMYVHPTNDNALRWARTKWRQMRQHSPTLKRIFGDAKSRSKTDTILQQFTRDGLGSLTISGANSAASLSMMTVQKQVQDDLSKWEPNIAGDPEDQADSRSASVDWAKILKLGTPLVADTCRITRSYKFGTQERWHVPCPHCATLQPLTWENFQATIDPEKPELAHFTCISCGEAIEHRHKRSIVARGRWVADNPRGREPSFHIWRAYAPSRDWASIAVQWLNAEGDPYREKTFYNDVLGLAFEEKGEAPPWQALRERAESGEAVYDRGQIPAGGLILTAGVDCQQDRTEVHIKTFGAGVRRWTIDYIVIPSHISTTECRDALDQFVNKKRWPDQFGNERGLDLMAIDANAFTNDVFAWARHHSWNRVICVRGAKSELAPLLALTKTERKPDGTTRRVQKRFYNVGTSQMKAALYDNLAKFDPLERGYCGYPRDLGDEFYRQLTAERREIKKDRFGFPRAFWRKAHDRNEVLDTEIYAEAAAIRCGFFSRTDKDWQNLAALMERARERGTPDLFDPAAPLPVSAPKDEGRQRGDSVKSDDRDRDYYGGRVDDYWRG